MNAARTDPGAMPVLERASAKGRLHDSRPAWLRGGIAIPPPGALIRRDGKESQGWHPNRRAGRVRLSLIVNL